MDHSHWYIAATLASGLNIALVVYLIKRASDQGKEFSKSLNELSKAITIEVDKAIDKFDKQCMERQSACSLRQDVKSNSMCQKLATYAAQNDKVLEDLARRREGAWKRHEEQMEKIWEAIRTHSHDR